MEKTRRLRFKIKKKKSKKNVYAYITKYSFEYVVASVLSIHPDYHYRILFEH